MLSFNRTIVELKQLKLLAVMLPTPAFNRTIVELKHIYASFIFAPLSTFNRTIVELKPVMVFVSPEVALSF